MLKEFNEDELEDMAYTVQEYLPQDELCSTSIEECKECENLECCHLQANTIYNQEFAESIDFGGYDSAEEFWDNL